MPDAESAQVEQGEAESARDIARAARRGGRTGGGASAVGGPGG
ncbi:MULTISPECIES: hypothetical protein [unclassified Streptomyces]|nr:MULTISPECIES: hypothetical protein [unclassified Streptomyces]